ncbi:hypothetical protein [Halorubrum halodurans]|uniref:DUF8119 domain-containing protein n=1 Tax=Halorubrum halodurans TaxID=1383851 RepID=A0A256ICP3_9EURY|nr:hypothetical protein [Halorubrum halodurans]OYR54308.1 hypothetical protein DJ70_14325 [Halorubrum halodurans]
MTETDPTDPIDDSEENALVDRLRSHVSENRTGMFQDLVFAVAWVTVVSLLFDHVLVGAPRWAFYLAMFGGVPAYFGFFASLAIAKRGR